MSRPSKWVAAVCTLWPCLALTAPAAPGTDRRALARTRSALASWIESSGLAGELEILGLSWTSRPDLPDARWLRLELRYLTQTMEADPELARLQQRWANAAAGSVPKGIFYKLIELAGVARSDALLEIHLVDRALLVFRDPAERMLVIREVKDRQIRAVSSLDALLAEHQGAGMVIAGDDVPRKIHALLQEHFARQNQASGLPPPTVTLKSVDSDYAGMEVEGIKGEIAGRRYWERLQIDADIEPVKSGRRVIWHLSGWYASGIGSRRPGASSYVESIPDTDLQAIGRTLRDGLKPPP